MTIKILYIIDSLTSGGKERQLVELLKGMINNNDFDIQLVVLSDVVDYDYVNNLKIEMHFIKRKYKKDISIFKKLYNICNIFKPDIIHSWELMCSVYGLPIAKLKRAKFINGIIRYSPAKFNIFESKWFVLTKITFLFSDIILSNSHAGLKSYNPPKDKSYCIYNGFDRNRLNGIKDTGIIKKKYNIETDYVVGMVARFHERKDYYLYLRSAINILQKRNNITFLAIGDGNSLDRCMDFVPTQYKEYIRFLGKQNDVESIINVFNIGVLASYEEGISNSIMEYMALGKPVVATRNGGNEEIVQNNITGYLVKPNNIEGLTEKIEILLDNKDISIAMGRAGKERLENEFSLEKMTEEHIKLYKKLIIKH